MAYQHKVKCNRYCYWTIIGLPIAVEKMNPEYIGASIELSLTPNHY